MALVNSGMIPRTIAQCMRCYATLTSSPPVKEPLLDRVYSVMPTTFCTLRNLATARVPRPLLNEMKDLLATRDGGATEVDDVDVLRRFLEQHPSHFGVSRLGCTVVGRRLSSTNQSSPLAFSALPFKGNSSPPHAVVEQRPIPGASPLAALMIENNESVATRGCAFPDDLESVVEPSWWQNNLFPRFACPLDCIAAARKEVKPLHRCELAELREEVKNYFDNDLKVIHVEEINRWFVIPRKADVFAPVVQEALATRRFSFGTNPQENESCANGSRLSPLERVLIDHFDGLVEEYEWYRVARCLPAVIHCPTCAPIHGRGSPPTSLTPALKSEMEELLPIGRCPFHVLLSAHYLFEISFSHSYNDATSPITSRLAETRMLVRFRLAPSTRKGCEDKILHSSFHCRDPREVRRDIDERISDLRCRRFPRRQKIRALTRTAEFLQSNFSPLLDEKVFAYFLFDALPAPDYVSSSSAGGKIPWAYEGDDREATRPFITLSRLLKQLPHTARQCRPIDFEASLLRYPHLFEVAPFSKGSNHLLICRADKARTAPSNLSPDEIIAMLYELFPVKQDPRSALSYESIKPRLPLAGRLTIKSQGLVNILSNREADVTFEYDKRKFVGNRPRDEAVNIRFVGQRFDALLAGYLERTAGMNASMSDADTMKGVAL